MKLQIESRGVCEILKDFVRNGSQKLCAFENFCIQIDELRRVSTEALGEFEGLRCCHVNGFLGTTDTHLVTLVQEIDEQRSSLSAARWQAWMWEDEEIAKKKGNRDGRQGRQIKEELKSKMDQISSVQSRCGFCSCCSICCSGSKFSLMKSPLH